jgi:hypothetical protein
VYNVLMKTDDSRSRFNLISYYIKYIALYKQCGSTHEPYTRWDFQYSRYLLYNSYLYTYKRLQDTARG